MTMQPAPALSVGVLQARWVGGSGDSLPLTRPQIRVGRGQQNDIVVEHALVSSQHLELTWQSDGWQVCDLGSSNGTFLDGRRLAARERLPLPYGSTMRLHNCLEMRLQPAGGRQPRVLTPMQVHFVERPQPGLIILQRSGQMQRLPLRKQRTTLGRSSRCDIVIENALLSGRHAEVVAQGGGQYAITDLGSRNGLTFRGQRVQSKSLNPGDRLYIGDQVLVEFQPALGFVTWTPSAAKAAGDQTVFDAQKLRRCPGCGATNFGPQTACLRCQTPLREGNCI